MTAHSSPMRDAVRRWRAHLVRNFLDLPERGLVDAVGGGDVHAALFDEVQIVAQRERGANSLPVIFRDAHDAAERRRTLPALRCRTRARATDCARRSFQTLRCCPPEIASPDGAGTPSA